MVELSLKEIQLAELDILLEFDRICRENNLKYSLAGGTLLGAIRHKGFIPWDDDIDVCMPRPDYEKLIKCFQSSCSDIDRFILTSDRGEKAEYPFAKILDRKISINEVGALETKNLWIDIFPIDGFPNNLSEIKKILKKAIFYRCIISYTKLLNFNGYKGSHGKIIFLIRKRIATIYGYSRAHRGLINLSQKNKYESSEFVGCVIWGIYGIGERMLKSEYEKSVEVEFEGRKFLAMSCWDSYLHGIYGDYMTLPPEEKRIVHGFKAYRIEENK